jgi:aspartokinase-like uncharacterized kinase
MNEPSRLVVVKVGGSLLLWPPLPDRLSRFLESRQRSGERVVLIAGGGSAADWVRSLDQAHRLGNEVSHDLALRSLDLSAQALSVLLIKADVVDSLADLAQVWQAGRVPILAPRLVWHEDERITSDPLPCSWNTTTDSIAARIASLLNADELVLLKSTNISSGITREQAASAGVVDPVFPHASQGLASIIAINLRDENDNGVRLI